MSSCNRKKAGKQRAVQAGFTLIELMISLTIGAIVIGSGVALYLQMSKNRNLVQAELELQNNSYYIQQTLRQFVNQAGYRSLDNGNLNTALLPVRSLDQSFAMETEGWNEGEVVRPVADGFAIRFSGLSDEFGAADGSFVNCLGVPVDSTMIEEVQFTVADGALLCTSGTTVVELISQNDDVNVEQIVLNWGIDTNNDLSVDEYRPATDPLGANDELLVLRFSFLLSSKDEVRNSIDDYTFNGATFTSADRRVRRELVTTIQLKH